MLVVSTRYATDEDIAIRASADFTILCPKDQRLAWGNDGQFSTNTPWVLTSAAVDFQAYGVAPGHVVLLTQPTPSFKPPGELFAVVAVAPNAVTLRRRGQPAGIGLPPGPAAGLSQVEFSVTTLGPQVALASYDLNRRFGIDDLIAGRRPCDLFDPNEVREAAVLTVLYRQYTDMGRGAGGDVDAFTAKARLYRQELDDLLARTVVHWLPAPGDTASNPSSGRFSTRLSR
jgi:hypothetical protein